MMNRQTPPGLRWGLILLLGALGLVRPLLSILGAYDALGGEALGPVAVTAILAVVWVGVVLVTHAPNPLLTLTLAGVSYGVLAILLQQIAGNIFLDRPPAEAPSPAPVLVVSWVAILVTNALWGAFLGLLATALGRLLPGRGPRRGAEA